MSKLHQNNTPKVDEFMSSLDHPFKSEVEHLREVIKNIDPDITEQIKWAAPSFSYKEEYLATFNLRDTKRIHLIFHNDNIAKIKNPILEGDFKDRRMVYFSREDMDVKVKELVKVIKELIQLLAVNN